MRVVPLDFAHAWKVVVWSMHCILLKTANRVSSVDEERGSMQYRRCEMKEELPDRKKQERRLLFALI